VQSKRKFINILTRTLYIVWTLLLFAFFVIITERTYTYAEYIATQEAMTSVNKDIAYRTWVSSHGGVYVPVDKRTPPNPYLTNIKDRDFKAIGKEFTLMNPAYTLSQMMHDYSKLYGIKTHITSKKLLNPKNAPDNWETIALNKIEQTRKEYIALNDIDKESYLRLMKPLVTTKTCLRCHAFQGYRVGDIRGGVSVAIPMKPLYSDAFKSSLLVLSLLFIIWLAGVFAIKLLSRKIYKYIDEKEVLYEQYIYGLVRVVEKRDTYTAGHSSRVADYAETIAKDMGFSDEDCHVLHRAGMLHDIGKVAIPDSVFLKPSRLSKREYELIQEHVEMSYEMLNNISIFDDIKEIVRDHHEHYDGSGYPRGLTAEDTPMLAQILMLADSFDAMTTDRIYKGRKSVKEALTEIAKLSGKQFNPKIVQSALRTLTNTIIDHETHQNPKNMLERERFSYFYKDPLTGLYNEAYLRSDLHTFSRYNFIVWVSLKNFHHYNKTYGWSSGDEILKNLATTIEYTCKESIQAYRFFGDNFVVLLDSEEQIEELSQQIHSTLEDKDVEVSIKTASLLGVEIEDKETLEDVLKKLF